MILYTMVSIEQDNVLHLERFKNQQPHPSYISGFIDGDGCIFIRKISCGYQSGISITQSRTNILQIMRYHFGGNITSNKNNKTENVMNDNNYYEKYTQRNEYNLMIMGVESSLLLNYVKNSIVIKKNQIECLNSFSILINLQNKIEEKDKLHKTCSEYNKKNILNEICFERINIEYIAGLFDAEGCLYISSKKNSKYYISITQKSYPGVLVHILSLLNFGTIDSEKKFKIYKKQDCLKFIELIKPHLIVKYNQAIAFKLFLETYDNEIKKEMYKICNKEKHEIEHFTDLNKNENGKDGYYETMRLKNIKSQFCKEIQLKQFYKEKSEKMKAEGNHNYGKAFSEETKKKMSSSIRDAKNSVSDETILNVRKLIEEGYKNIEIQEILKLPRHTITRIKNGNIVLRSEEKIQIQTLTQIETNLSKRKILPKEIIIVIEKYIEEWKPMKILDYLIEERNKKNIENTLTIDIIKNIKRNLTNNKNIIYETELTKERYEYYLSLREKFNK